MSTCEPRTSSRPRWAMPLYLSVFVLCIMAGGCNCYNLRGEGFEPGRFPDAPTMRSPDGEAGAMGFSTKAREVERSLGVIP